MGTMVTTGNLSRGLWPGVNAFFGANHPQYVGEFEQIFEKYCRK